MRGAHPIKFWSRTQGAVALSSAEAELIAMVKATSEGMGMVAIMAEYGMEVSLTIKNDAVHAIGIVRRQGFGRIRHLELHDPALLVG